MSLVAYARGGKDIKFNQPASNSGVHEWHGAGPGQPVQIIRQRPDRIAGFGESRFVTDTVVLRLRISDASTLTQGDLIEITGEGFQWARMLAFRT